jgi:hypothetical protein
MISQTAWSAWSQKQKKRRSVDDARPPRQQGPRKKARTAAAAAAAATAATVAPAEAAHAAACGKVAADAPALTAGSRHRHVPARSRRGAAASVRDGTGKRGKKPRPAPPRGFSGSDGLVVAVGGKVADVTGLVRRLDDLQARLGPIAAQAHERVAAQLRTLLQPDARRMLSSATASWASQERARLLLQLEALERLPRSPTAAPVPAPPPPPPLPPPPPSAASPLLCDSRSGRKLSVAARAPAHAPPAPASAAAVVAGACPASHDGNETEDSADDR